MVLFRQMFPREIAIALVGLVAFSAGCAGNWYERSFYLLHEDYHTSEGFEVGRDADPDVTARLVALSKPDVVQIHAKGNPGWTTYPTRIGYTPPRLSRDVLAIWRDMARQDGYHWSIYYNLGRDGEIMKRHPAWNRVAASGKPLDKMLCYHSGVAENYLWPMIDEEIGRYQPDGFWFDGSVFTVSACYCEKCRERFTRETRLEAPRRPDAEGWPRFQEMQRQIYREFVHDTCRRIHSRAPATLVAVNWAYSIRMPEKPDPGVSYLTGDVGRVEDLSGEAHFYDGQGLPFDLMTPLWTMEEAPAPDGKKKIAMTPKPRPQIEQEMAVIIANGGRYFLWDNPTPEGGLVPERNEFAGHVVGPFLRARQPYCLGYARVPEVSLLHSAAAHYAATQRSTVAFARHVNNAIDGAAGTLTRMHLNYEMIADWRLAAGKIRSPLLVIENPKALAPETIEPLCAWVRKGGRLLLTGSGGTLSPGLTELIGWEGVHPPGTPESLAFEEGTSQITFQQVLFRGRHDGATTLCSVRDAKGTQQPILTVRKTGRGSAYYVPLPLLSLHDAAHTIPDTIVRTVLDRILPETERRLTTDAPPDVEIVLRRSENRLVVHLVNMATGQRETTRINGNVLTRVMGLPRVAGCSISLRAAKKPRRIRIEPQGAEVTDWQFEDGRIRIHVPAFDVHQMIVVDSR